MFWTRDCISRIPVPFMQVPLQFIQETLGWFVLSASSSGSSIESNKSCAGMFCEFSSPDDYRHYTLNCGDNWSLQTTCRHFQTSNKEAVEYPQKLFLKSLSSFCRFQQTIFQNLWKKYLVLTKSCFSEYL